MEPYKPAVEPRPAGAERHPLLRERLRPAGLPPDDGPGRPPPRGRRRGGLRLLPVRDRGPELGGRAAAQGARDPVHEVAARPRSTPRARRAATACASAPMGPSATSCRASRWSPTAFRAYMAADPRADPGRSRRRSSSSPTATSMARHQCFEWAKTTAKGTVARAARDRARPRVRPPPRRREEGHRADRRGARRRGPGRRAAMKQAADAHLAAQTDFDPGDGFEEDALRLAHTVFMAGFAAGGAERAARDFAVVREATKELLAVDLGLGDARGRPHVVPGTHGPEGAVPRLRSLQAARRGRLPRRVHAGPGRGAADPARARSRRARPALLGRAQRGASTARC